MFVTLPRVGGRKGAVRCVVGAGNKVSPSPQGRPKIYSLGFWIVRGSVSYPFDGVHLYSYNTCIYTYIYICTSRVRTQCSAYIICIRVLYRTRWPPLTDVYCVGDERETPGSSCDDRGREIVTGLKALTWATICSVTAPRIVFRLLGDPRRKPRHGSRLYELCSSIETYSSSVAATVSLRLSLLSFFFFIASRHCMIFW